MLWIKIFTKSLWKLSRFLRLSLQKKSWIYLRCVWLGLKNDVSSLGQRSAPFKVSLDSLLHSVAHQQHPAFEAVFRSSSSLKSRAWLAEGAVLWTVCSGWCQLLVCSRRSFHRGKKGWFSFTAAYSTLSRGAASNISCGNWLKFHSWNVTDCPAEDLHHTRVFHSGFHSNPPCPILLL